MVVHWDCVDWYWYWVWQCTRTSSYQSKVPTTYWYYDWVLHRCYERLWGLSSYGTAPLVKAFNYNIAISVIGIVTL